MLSTMLFILNDPIRDGPWWLRSGYWGAPILISTIINLFWFILTLERFAQLPFALVYVAKGIKLVFKHLFVLVRQIAGDLSWLHTLHGMH